MKVVLSTPGKFHSFDLARQMEKRGFLHSIFTGYPRFKLRNEGLPQSKIRTFPWLQAPYMKWGNAIPAIRREWESLLASTFDGYVAKHLPDSDVFCGLSGCATRSGREARRRGIRYVCDRGSSHIRYQDRILREEHEIQGIPWRGVDPRTIEREEAEYEEADVITVPSTFALKSFVECGVRRDKLRLVPYGVDLTRFQPGGCAPEERFEVLYVGGLSVRKGLNYLLRAFDLLVKENKRLTLAGNADSCPRSLLRTIQDRKDTVLRGHVPQTELREIMSRSHVMVLPSLEEGLALVQAQAMACGCPVIASENTGAADLFTDGKEGFITPIRDVVAIAERLQQLADDPRLREQMGIAAQERTKSLGGWDFYGERILSVFREHQP